MDEDRETATRKLIETTEWNSQKGHIPFTAITAKYTCKKAAYFKYKILRIYL